MLLMWSAAASTAVSTPSRRKISRLRRVRLRAFGYTKISRRFSTSSEETPCWASNVDAARRPTPAPTIEPSHCVPTSFAPPCSAVATTQRWIHPTQRGWPKYCEDLSRIGTTGSFSSNDCETYTPLAAVSKPSGPAAATSRGGAIGQVSTGARDRSAPRTAPRLCITSVSASRLMPARPACDGRRQSRACDHSASISPVMKASPAPRVSTTFTGRDGTRNRPGRTHRERALAAHGHRHDRGPASTAWPMVSSCRPSAVDDRGFGVESQARLAGVGTERSTTDHVQSSK